MRLREYYHLTKPGIVYSNLLTAAAGFFLASHGSIDLQRLIALLIGLALVIAAACVCNNIIDRDIDERMNRTKERALVSGAISPRAAIVFAMLLIAMGSILLYVRVGMLALCVALAGCIAYLALYTPLKRRTIFSTHIGAIAGATPPVVGYTAVTHTLDATALLLFLILALWQIPHFFAIAIYRADDYRSARIPLWPFRKGLRSTRLQMLYVLILFTVATLLLYPVAHTGPTYLSVMMLVCAYWIFACVRGFHTPDEKRWARTMFFISLSALSVWSVLLIAHL